MKGVIGAVLVMVGILAILAGPVVCFVIGVQNIVGFATTDGAAASQLVWGICEVVFAAFAALPGYAMTLGGLLLCDQVDVQRLQRSAVRFTKKGRYS